MKRIILILSLLLSAGVLKAQFYTGMSGLIHVPSADVYTEGDLRVGTYFLNKHFTPSDAFIDGGGKIQHDGFLSVCHSFQVVRAGLCLHSDEKPASGLQQVVL